MAINPANSGQAEVTCDYTWTVSGSKTKGATPFHYSNSGHYKYVSVQMAEEMHAAVGKVVTGFPNNHDATLKVDLTMSAVANGHKLFSDNFQWNMDLGQVQEAAKEVMGTMFALGDAKMAKAANPGHATHAATAAADPAAARQQADHGEDKDPV